MMIKLWLIEGHAGVGKTTLVERMSSYISTLKVLKLSPEFVPQIRNDWRDDMLAAHILGVTQPAGAIAMDRSIISGLAYEPYMAEDSFYRAWYDWLTLIQPFADKQEIALVHLTAPSGVRYKRLQRRDGSALGAGAVRSAPPKLDAYAYQAGQTLTSYIQIDVSGLTPEQVWDRLKWGKE